MNYANNFAFFWVGDDISIPQLLVNSINKSYSNDVNIFFLTDNKTPDIYGTTQTLRNNLSSNIMIARLEAYSELKVDDQVFFLDADKLVTSKIEKINSKDSFIIFRRKKEGIKINHLYPEWYPEFKNKTLDEMMPYLFNLIVTNSKSSYDNFNKLVRIANELPRRFHRWYGDQYALKIAVDKKLIDFQEFEMQNYVDEIKKIEDFTNAKKSILHFKGIVAKTLMQNYYSDYLK